MTSPAADCKHVGAKQSVGLYHNFWRLQLGINNPLHRYSMPSSPSSLLFSFSSVRDGFVLMMEERSSQLLLERLQSSNLKEKERRSTLVLKVALFSLAGAQFMKAKWPIYSPAVPGCLHKYVHGPNLDVLSLKGCSTAETGQQIPRPQTSVLCRRGHMMQVIFLGRTSAGGCAFI